MSYFGRRNSQLRPIITYDTMYHAIALEHDDAVLVTADDRYRRKAERYGMIAALADWERSRAPQFGRIHPPTAINQLRATSTESAPDDGSTNSAVSCIVNGGSGKSDIWRINAEDEYHEQIGASS